MELIQHDVRGLDIPMNDLLFVGELERFTHRRNYRQSVRSRNTVLEDRLMEIATRQIFHDEEEVTFLFEPFFEHLNDAGMMQCRHLARTPEETLATGAIIGVLPVQHLDRHHCMTLPVETFLNGRKAAMPQAFEQSEMAIQQKIARLELRTRAPPPSQVQNLGICCRGVLARRQLLVPPLISGFQGFRKHIEEWLIGRGGNAMLFQQATPDFIPIDLGERFGFQRRRPTRILMLALHRHHQAIANHGGTGEALPVGAGFAQGRRLGNPVGFEHQQAVGRGVSQIDQAVDVPSARFRLFIRGSRLRPLRPPVQIEAGFLRAGGERANATGSQLATSSGNATKAMSTPGAIHATVAATVPKVLLERT